MSLFAGLPYKDRLGNDIFTDFRNMLRLEAVLDDPDLDETGKVMNCLVLLYGENIPEDVVAAHDELLWFYYRGQTPEKPKRRIKKLFDFEEDATYIVGAFLSEYRLDLTDEEVYLHWWQFMTLFIALPDDTPMMKRMCDRNVDLSKLKGEMRRYYEERQKAVALKAAKKAMTGTYEERREAGRARIKALYAEAERALAEKTD